MEIKKKPWWRRKTTWHGIGTILASVAGIVTGAATLQVGAAGVVAGVWIIIDRDNQENIMVEMKRVEQTQKQGVQ